MVQFLKNMMSIMILGGLAWHASSAVDRSLQAAANLKETFLVSQNMSVILRSVVVESTLEEKFTVPTDPGLVQRYIRGLMRLSSGGDSSLDPWGTPYRLDLNGRRLTVGSAGPDKVWNTSDDKYLSGSLN